MTDPTTDARYYIRHAWSVWTKDIPAYDINEMAQVVAEKLLGVEGFPELFLETVLPETVVQVAKGYINRDPEMTQIGAIAGKGPSAFRAYLEASVSVPAAFAEWIGGERKHVLDLTKRQLLEKADKRSATAHKEASRAAWYRKLAERMTDDQTVRDAWSEDEATKLRESINATVTTAQIVPFIRAAAD